MENRSDLRVRRTQKHLRSALLDLLKEKPLDEIQVKELAERAEISRATFYLYYDSVRGMMHDIEEEIFSDYVDILADILRTQRPFLDVFQDLLRRPFTEDPELFPFIKYIYSSHGTHYSMRRGAELIKKELLKRYDTGMPDDIFNYLFDFVISGSIAVIGRWTLDDAGSCRSQDELAKLLRHLLLNGEDYIGRITLK